ncbi:hypothetical protein TcWFU_001795 [Taenia crassiceps]|uniref:Uncharacterized protein n=1 Tax=Taenia crassiceps TaxID=6207 RepID=A0ABR4Q5Z7_9CEST
MSIIHTSAIQCGPVFLKAAVAWISGDLTNTQVFCLQCLEGLRYNPTFPHLAACLYFLAFCAKSDNRTEYADDVIDCLQNKCNSKALRFNLPWSLLESFNGTSKSFFELANNDDAATLCNGDINGDSEVDGGGDGEYFIAPPAWYHHSCNHLTPENYESLSLFCLEMGLRELGVAFAVRAHQESKRRESPDLYVNDGDAYSAAATLSSSYLRIPSLSLPLLRHLDLPLPLRPDEEGLLTDDLEVVFPPVAMNQPPHKHQSEESVVRRRARGSILKSPSCGNDFDRFVYSDATGDDGSVPLVYHDSPRVEKRVRFSLSASHPPPDIEAEFGGRSNSQRLQDMARRRGYLYPTDDVVSAGDDNDDSDDSGSGAFDRLVGVFWPDGGGSSTQRRLRWRGRQSYHHHLGRCLLDVSAFLTCLLALLIFSLLFLSLVVCIPLAWFTTSTGDGSVLTGICIRLLNTFGLHALLLVLKFGFALKTEHRVDGRWTNPPMVASQQHGQPVESVSTAEGWKRSHLSCIYAAVSCMDPPSLQPRCKGKFVGSLTNDFVHYQHAAPHSHSPPLLSEVTMSGVDRAICACFFNWGTSVAVLTVTAKPSICCGLVFMHVGVESCRGLSRTTSRRTSLFVDVCLQDRWGAGGEICGCSFLSCLEFLIDLDHSVHTRLFAFQLYAILANHEVVTNNAMAPVKEKGKG